jgi:hypothetical protein
MPPSCCSWLILHLFPELTDEAKTSLEVFGDVLLKVVLQVELQVLKPLWKFVGALHCAVQNKMATDSLIQFLS